MKIQKNKSNPISDKATGFLAKCLLRLQNKFANVMGRLSASWKAKQKWIFLYMVSFVFGGLSLMAIIKPFNRKAQNDLPKPAAIKTIRSFHKENSPVRITENEYRQVQKFKRSLDSASLKKLLLERPGLMDSLELVEQLYYSQKK